MLKASIDRNDKTAYMLIGMVSVVVFAAVVLLRQDEFKLNVGFRSAYFCQR